MRPDPARPGAGRGAGAMAGPRLGGRQLRSLAVAAAPGDEYHELTPGVFVRVVSMSVEMAREKMVDPAAWGQVRPGSAFPAAYSTTRSKCSCPWPNPAGAAGRSWWPRPVWGGPLRLSHQMGALGDALQQQGHPARGRRGGGLSGPGRRSAPSLPTSCAGALCPVDDPGSLPESPGKMAGLDQPPGADGFSRRQHADDGGLGLGGAAMPNPPPRWSPTSSGTLPLRREGQVFVDQVQYMGIRQGGDGEALTHAQAFVNSLIGEETQMRNAALSVLPARTGLTSTPGRRAWRRWNRPWPEPSMCPTPTDGPSSARTRPGASPRLIDAASAAGGERGLRGLLCSGGKSCKLVDRKWGIGPDDRTTLGALRGVAAPGAARIDLSARRAHGRPHHLQGGWPADFWPRWRMPGSWLGCWPCAAGRGVPALMMGNGSNLRLRDGGIRGVVIQCGPG